MKILRSEPEIDDYVDPKAVFEKLANFVTSIDIRFLTESQKIALLSIIEKIEDDDEPIKGDDILDKINEVLRAKQSASEKKQYAVDYYLKNKGRLKGQKSALKTSLEGNKRKVMGPIMARQERTPCGKKKLSYNV